MRKANVRDIEAQVQCVIQIHSNRLGEHLQYMHHSWLETKELPDGFYSVTHGKIYLPKRKRGDKFIVRQLVIKETTF